MRRSEKSQKKRSKLSLTLKVILMLAASLLICVSAYGIYITKKAEKAANSSYEELGDRSISNLREAKVEPITDNISVLFIGVDDSEKRGQGAEHSRSDALVLATLNNESKTVKLVSIPRDSNVYIPYVGYNDKITHAHAYGGTLATIETVENLFDVPVDYYVRMNFEAFIDVIDALGGITVDVNIPYAFTEKDEFDKYTVELTPGPEQHLNGSQALALARTRKIDSDIERGKRQQEIIKAMAKEAASIKSITKYGDVIDAVGDNMKTDMTFDEMKALFSYLLNGIPQIDTLQLVGYDDWTTGTYYYTLDEESLKETKSILQSHLGLIPDTSNISGTTNDTGVTENTQGYEYDNQ
ncbi:LCP family protein [Ureibacillus sp. NPDC094379]